MSAAQPDPLRRRATALRRAVFGVYAGALAAGTHWPRLELGDPARPPDKMLHFIAFAGLAVMLWEARLVRRHATLLAVGLLWIWLDEWTQRLPGLGRVFSYEDIAAGALGFLAATAVLWALRPVGGPAARLRRARFDALLDSLLARPVAWGVLGSSAALGATIGVPGAILVDRLLGGDGAPFQTALVGGVLGAAAVGGAMLVAGLRFEDERMRRDGRCLRCGERRPRDAAACPTCARPALPGQWHLWPIVGWGDVRRAFLVPVAGAFATLLLLSTLWLGVLAARRDVAIAARIDDLLRSLSPGMTSVIDATLLTVVLAVAIDRARHRLARRIERGAERCVGCGQDLRATPVAAEGVGRCGECGGAFLAVRLRSEENASTMGA